MPRRIVTTQLQAAGAGGQQLDTYFDRVLKYIPADVVAAWVAVTGILSGSDKVPTTTLLWIAFIVGVIFTAVWTYTHTQAPGKPPAKTQTLLATVAFIVWVFALGGPFTTLGFYHSLYGSVVLILYSLIVGLINPPEG